MKTYHLYHGSNQNFDRFEQSKSRIPNDFYGAGVAYFTDDLVVAKTYASSMARSKGGNKMIYEVAVHFNRLFDVDQTFSGNALTKFYRRNEVEAFARGAGLLYLGADKYTVLGNLEDGRESLTGNQVFKGLSNGMNKTAFARERLKSLGFDGLRYNGGTNIGISRHNVYLAYDAGQIRIKNISSF